MTELAHDIQPEMLEQILASEMPPADEKAAIEQCVQRKPALAVPLLFNVLAQKQRLRAMLDEANKVLLEPPWHPASFLSLCSNGERALVACGNRRLSVVMAPGVDRLALRCGQSIFLNAGQNVLTDIAADLARPGAVGEFRRLHGAGRGVIRSQADEEIVVELGSGILEHGVERGELLLYDPESYIAFEKIEKSNRSGLLDDLPLNVRIEDLGGLDAVFNDLVSEVTVHLFHRELVHRYQLKPTRGVLLCGPPGTGKTSLVQALGEHLTRTMRTQVSVFLVRPGVHRSMWFGASEQRVRDLFREAREAAEQRDRYVLLFFDDMDHLGSRDHRLAGEIDARLLPCFLQEVDAVRTHKLLLLGATNREDLLDEALLRPGRFGKTIRIGRPTRAQAREIFRRYLTADLPIRQNGHDSAETVDRLIDDLLTVLYAPNGDLSTLATLTFRDGSRQPLTASQIISGALIAAAVEQAKRLGCFRVLDGGPGELSADDLRRSVTRELSAICERLKPGPALQQMLDLPPDRDVVKVERRSHEQRPHRSEYITLSAT